VDRKRAKQQGGSEYKVPPSRQGKLFVGGYFDAEVRRELKVIAAREGSSIQDLVGQGIEMVLKLKGIHRKVVEEKG
jgi:hypothetical protein